MEPDGAVVDIEQIQVTVGELIFDVWVAGPEDGIPVILLHGFPQTWIEYEAQIEALAASGFRAIAPNQRGYSAGARPPETSAYQATSLVADILGIATELGYDRFHLVGHDWGASIAWFLALFSPDRLLSLTAISVPHPQPFQETVADPESCQSASSAYFQDFIQPDSHERLLANDAEVLRSFYEGLPAHHVEDYLSVFTQDNALKAALDWYRANVSGGGPSIPFPPCTVPTLYVWGTEDPYLCRDPAYLTEAHVSADYEFLVLDGVGHWVPENAADELSEAILEHVTTFSE